MGVPPELLGGVVPRGGAEVKTRRLVSLSNGTCPSAPEIVLPLGESRK